MWPSETVGPISATVPRTAHIASSSSSPHYGYSPAAAASAPALPSRRCRRRRRRRRGSRKTQVRPRPEQAAAARGHLLHPRRPAHVTFWAFFSNNRDCADRHRNLTPDAVHAVISAQHGSPVYTGTRTLVVASRGFSKHTPSISSNV